MKNIVRLGWKKKKKKKKELEMELELGDGNNLDSGRRGWSMERLSSQEGPIRSRHFATGTDIHEPSVCKSLKQIIYLRILPSREPEINRFPG